MFPADDWKEVCSLLHEEIDRLPERCRVPVVLCDLEGLTHEQAARRLCWPVGTVKSRLNRGREWLRGRLIRRGVAPAVGILGVALTAQSAPVAVSANLVEATVRAARDLVAGVTTAGVVPATVALLLEGAMNAMFMTKMRLAVLACGLLATGAVVVAQQSGRAPTAEGQPPQVEVIQVPATPSDEADVIDAIVARDMGRLDVELLREQLQILKNDLQHAYRRKAQAERPESADFRGDPDSPRVSLKNAQGDYESARAEYMAKLRELTVAIRRVETDKPARKPAQEGSRASTPPSKKPSGNQETARSAPNPPAAVIGSIDIDAVMKRWVKVQEANKSYQDALRIRRGQLLKLETEAKEGQELYEKFSPGSAEAVRLGEKISALRRQIESEREAANRDFTQRQAQLTAALYQEIQDAVASIVRTKGLNYVVKVSPGPRTDSDPNDVMTAIGRSVLYADPRNDITEEVIRDLNQRTKASGANTSK